NSHHPPLSPSGGGRRPAAGAKTIDSFAQGIVETKFAKELESFSEGFTIYDKDLAKVDKMEEYSSKLLHERIQNKCPTLFNTLCNLADTAIPGVVPDDDGDGEGGDEKEMGHSKTPKKDPYFGIVMQVASLDYCHNQHCNALQKYLSIYMQAQHLGKSAFFLLQQAGIVMSYSWTRRAIKVMDEDMRILVEKIAQPALNYNGTAITVIHLPASALALENCSDFKAFMRSLDARRMQGTAPKLSWEDLAQPCLLTYNKTSSTHDILDLLKKIPELSNIDWKAEKLKRPTGPKQLPHGPEHRVEQTHAPID
ncbi:hypothetical protein FRC11_004678, partial [Ceratobasidium sp. 423]